MALISEITSAMKKQQQHHILMELLKESLLLRTGSH